MQSLTPAHFQILVHQKMSCGTAGSVSKSCEFQQELWHSGTDLFDKKGLGLDWSEICYNGQRSHSGSTCPPRYIHYRNSFKTSQCSDMFRLLGTAGLYRLQASVSESSSLGDDS